MTSDEHAFGYERKNNYDKITSELEDIKIKNALEKQIPTKVEAGTEAGFDWYCKCGNYLCATKQKEINYCPKCGQKLDWDNS